MAETDLTPEEAAADTRLPLYNVGDYDPVSNEFGFDNDGHQVNQMRQARDAGVMGRLARRLAIYVSSLVALTAEDASNTAQDRIATSQDRTGAAGSAGTAKAEADRAAGFAAGLNLPGISAAVAGFFLRVKGDGSGWEASRLDVATQAQAEAGTNQTALMSPQRTSQAIMALAGDVVKEVYTANATFAKQADDIGYLVELIGPGASGAKASGSESPMGGGPGEVIEHFFSASEVPDNLPMTVGAGGSAVTVAGGAGVAGGVTSFGNLLRALGGVSGPSGAGAGTHHAFGVLGQAVIGSSGNPGVVSGVLKTFQGARFALISAADAERTAPVFMPTAGAGLNATSSAGTTVPTFGDYGRGGAASLNANAQAGQVPGGGGGAVGSGAGLASGAGARGEIRVFRFKRRKAA